MKSPSKMTITTFALAFAVGFGGIGATPVNAAPPTHAASSAPPAALPAPGTTNGGVQQATLTGCISDLNC